MYTVYVLHSPDHGKIYIGYTSNLTNRILAHNELASKGWASRFRPWKIIHLENFNSKQEAMQRERMLKGGQGRKWIRDELLKEK